MFKSFALFKNSAIYLLTNLINAAIPFALIPILTNYLSPAEYGILALYTLFVTFIIPFVGLGVNGALLMKYFTITKIEFRGYIANCFYLTLCSMLLCLILIALFKSDIASFSGLPEQILYTVVFISFFQVVTLILQSILQAKEKPLSYGLLQIGVSLLNFVLSYIFVVKYLKGWEGRLQAWEISTGIFAFISIFILIYVEKPLFRINFSYIKNILRFSLPLIPHTIGGIIIALSDRVIISKILGLRETGIYTISFQISSIFLIVLVSFNSAYIPWLFNKLKKNDTGLNVRIVAMSYYLMIGICLLVLTGYLVSPMVFKIFVGEDFQEGSRYLFWMLLSFGFNGMYFIPANYIFYAGKTHLLGLTTFFVALINLPLCYFFTKNWGLIGSVQSTAISFFLLFAITWILSNKVFPMPWKQGLAKAMHFKGGFKI